MHRTSLCFGLYLLAQSLIGVNGFAQSFSFHLKNEPKSLEPSSLNSGDSTYLIGNLYRGLTRYTEDGNLIFDQAEKCSYKTPVLIRCHLRKESKWSDGSQVKAEDFANGFRRLLLSKARVSSLSLLFGIKNAKAILDGKLPGSELGVRAEGDTDLIFELISSDTEFFEKLSDPLLVPLKNGLFNGPYKLGTWIKGQKIILEPNYYYNGGASHHRPRVEIYFVKDDASTLGLYQKGVLTFLGGISTEDFSKFKDRADFFKKPMARFDYIGFNLKKGSPFENLDLRRSFAESLNFDDFKSRFFDLSTPGCPGLGDAILAGYDHCVGYVSKRPNAMALASVPASKVFKFYGHGNFNRKEALWFQEQWKQDLGVNTAINDFEKNSSDIFWETIPLSRPTCLAGLENFKKGASKNSVGFENIRFENLTDSLISKKMSMSEKQGICGVATDLLFKEEYVGIPLGITHLLILANRDFRGWTLNELNQLDLSDLSYVGPVRK